MTPGCFLVPRYSLMWLSSWKIISDPISWSSSCTYSICCCRYNLLAPSCSVLLLFLLMPGQAQRSLFLTKITHGHGSNTFSVAIAFGLGVPGFYLNDVSCQAIHLGLQPKGDSGWHGYLDQLEFSIPAETWLFDFCLQLPRKRSVSDTWSIPSCLKLVPPTSSGSLISLTQSFPIPHLHPVPTLPSAS